MNITITIDTKNETEVIEAMSFLSQYANKEVLKGVEEPKKEKTTQSKPRAKKEPESVPTKVEEPKKDERDITVDLSIVKGLAQKLAKTSPETKEKVKEVIGKYSTDTKLTGVSEKDYGNLYKDLQALN